MCVCVCVCMQIKKQSNIHMKTRKHKLLKLQLLEP